MKQKKTSLKSGNCLILMKSDTTTATLENN